MNIQQIMKQAQEMQKKMAELQSKLAEKEVFGKAGGGLVQVMINGKGELKKVDINVELLKPSEKEVLQDLIVAAFTDAKGRVESDFNSEMSGIAGDLGLPEGFKFPNT